MITEDDLSQLIKIAHLARKSGLLSLSERIFEHFSHAYPLHAFPHIGLGLIFFDKGRYIKACIEFEHAIMLGEENKDIYLHYGICQYVRGNFIESVRALQRALELDKEEGGSDITASAMEVLELPELSGLHRRHLESALGVSG
jgi:tetratricopeptide (TPR) repeat protein